MRKKKVFLACTFLACVIAFGARGLKENNPKCEVFAGINYYVQHSGGSIKWKARAGVATMLSGVARGACMKAALIGSGAGPVGSLLAVGAIAL